MISIFRHTQKSYCEEIFARLGKGKQHAAQLYAHWFRRGTMEGIEEWAERQALELVREMIEMTDVSMPEMVNCKEEGETVKFLLRYGDGVESESVVIPMKAGLTLCISSQIGCRMGCSFCETGKMGLVRHLNGGEIVAQVFWARFGLGKRVRNIVFMGMGEPMDNFDEVMQAVRVLTDPHGMGFGPRHVTISTSGHVEGIRRLKQEGDRALHLAVSINGAIDGVRNRLMPVNKRWNLAEIKVALQEYGRPVLIGYVMMKGVNDSLADADALAEYLSKLDVKINLIPYNPQSRDRYACSEWDVIEAFATRLKERGYQVLLRGTKGQKIMAACGQLGNNKFKRQLQNSIAR